MSGLPPLSRVERALQQATERFAAELHAPSGSAPNWTDFEWRMARAAAVLHGVTPLLAGVLRWRGPRSWERFVSLQRIHTAVRQQRIAALLGRIDAQARHRGLGVIPLKGAAMYRLGLYTGGERPMADVDVLVGEHDGVRMQQLLRSLGFLDTSVSWKHRVFEPVSRAVASARKAAYSFGEHADRPIKIELHTAIAERLPLRTADISGLILAPVANAGLIDYPCMAALFAHLLLHAAGSMLIRTLRLIQLHDLALLAARMRDADWAHLLTYQGKQHALWWSIPPLELLARYYPDAVPPAVITALRPGCPRTLRTLSRRQTLPEVSFAALRFEAFPGLPWCSSLAEKLRYVLDRALPERAQLAHDSAVRANEDWVAEGSWYRLSHGRRVLLWAMGHPPRPPTMHAVRCALADPAVAPGPPRPTEGASRGAARTR